MAVRRGLNKSRGLESLIPQKIRHTETEQEQQHEFLTGTEYDEVPADRNKKTEPEEVPVKSAKKTSTSGKRTARAEKRPGDSENKPEVLKTNKRSSGTRKVENKAGAMASKVENSQTRTAKKTSENEILILSISDVVPNQDQPRQDFQEDALRELADSIKEHGILQPLLVHKKGRYYEIIAGERRWRAARLAGLKKVPAIIRDFTDQEAMEVALIENIQREDLNAIEEAEAYQTLIDEFHLKQADVAKRVGKNRTTVTNSLRLLKLAVPVRKMLADGSISMGHARALLAIEDEKKQSEAAEKIISEKLSVRQTEKLVKDLLNPGKKKTKEEPDEQIVLAYRNLEKKMSESIGTKVKIHAHGDKGKVEIEYYSQDDLEKIAEVLGRS